MDKPASNPPGTPEIVPLGYAPSRRGLGRRATKILIALAVLIGLLTVGWLDGRHAVLFARQWYWERECMDFSPTSDVVIDAMLKDWSFRPKIEPPYMDGSSDEVCNLSTLLFTPDISTDLTRVPICWVRFLESTGNLKFFASSQQTSVGFCHRRTSLTGHLRLVIVEIHPAERFEFACEVYAPVDWNGCPLLVPGGIWKSQDFASFGSDVRVFAGQPDPADASRFRIRYQNADRIDRFIDGQLLDNDSVTLTDCAGTATHP